MVTGGHREQAIDIFFDGERVVELAGPRYADGAAHGSGCTHSSALAARLAHGDDPQAARARAKRVASEAVRDGLRTSGPAPGPSTSSGSRAPADPLRRQVPTMAMRGPGSDGRTPALCHNRLTMRFLRMKPGHGEVLIAEGDVEVAEEEELLVAGVPPPARRGHVGRRPRAQHAGRREARMVKAFDEIPRDADRVIFFPRAAGGAEPGSTTAADAPRSHRHGS